ncbi:MAG: hypothetical protein JOZ99_00665 [Actinobacteria bacterium]|nr:hypothetical protein [Actinomycetota bacterium]
MNSLGDRPATSHRRTVWSAARVLGGLSLLAVGAVHIQQYSALYSAIPTIGTLFVLDFVGTTLLGVGLLMPFERFWRRRGKWIETVMALGGVALAGASYVFLLVAERRPLFGFMEPGYDPNAIRAAQAGEIAAVLLLGAYLVIRYAPARSARWRSALHTTQEVRT